MEIFAQFCKDPFLEVLNNLTDSFNERYLFNNANKNSFSHVESNDSQNDSEPDINTFHKIPSGQMTGTIINRDLDIN